MIAEINNGDVGLTSVLILEDEALVAMAMEQVVRDLGVDTVHVVCDTASALALLHMAEIDCAVLDVLVRDGPSHGVADHLLARGIPFIFSTGNRADALPERHRHLPVLSKPFADDNLCQLLLDAVAAARADQRRPPTEAAACGSGAGVGVYRN